MTGHTWEDEWPDGYDPDAAWTPDIKDLTMGDPGLNPGLELKHWLNESERAVWTLLNHTRHDLLMQARQVRGVDVDQHLVFLDDRLRDKAATEHLALYREAYQASLRAIPYDSREPQWYRAWLYARALRMAGKMPAEAELIRDFLTHWEGRWERNGQIAEARRRLAAIEKRLHG